MPLRELGYIMGWESTYGAHPSCESYRKTWNLAFDFPATFPIFAVNAVKKHRNGKQYNIINRLDDRAP